MRMTKIVLSCLSALLAGAVFANGGNCMKKAVTLKSSQTATLVNEYDPEWKEYYDDGGLWYKIKLARYSSATVWIEGGDAANISLDVSTDMDDENAPWVSWSSEEYRNGDVQACFLDGNDWDEEDPKSGTFYVYLSGDIGATTTLRYSSGIVSFVQVGEADNPKSITMKDADQTVTASAIDGEYWLKAKLTAGRKYLVWTAGGKTNATFSVSAESSEVLEEETSEYGNAYNDARYLLPEETGTYNLVVGSDTSSGKFTLHYRSIPALAIAKHEYTDLDNDGHMAAIVAGRLHKNYDHYDDIVDEGLCRISLVKGERWVFETEGANTNVVLRVYDSTGKTLVVNESKDGGNSMDCRGAIQAGTTGYYYVGVCGANLAVEDASPTGKITIRATNADTFDAPDWSDPVDDVYTGASLLAAFSGTSENSVLTDGLESGPHGLDGGDWYDCFMLPVIKGNTYQLAADTATDENIRLNLDCKVFTISSGKEKSITTTGSLTYEGNNAALTFTASANALVYLRVWVKEGVGLYYPAFHLRTLAYRTDGKGLGSLTVGTKGADGKWCVTSAKYYYPNGATINVVTNAGTSVTFSAVTGFSTPTNQVSDPIVLGKTVGLTGIYNDTYDHYQITKNKKKDWVSDDNASGAVAISTTAGKEKTAARTLWATDPQDLFTFTAAAGVYYNFEIVGNPADEDLGDATIVVSNSTGVVVGPTQAIGKRRFDAGPCVLAVTHASSGQDAAYVLKYSTFNAGTLKFSAAEYSVKENAGYVNLTVNRSAAEGVMRVKWSTAEVQADAKRMAAKPGEDYYPDSGVLTWANGDKAAKTIKVRLIPNAVATVESNKVFSVVLKAMDADEIADDEYPATITLDTAKVVMTEVTAKAAGKITAVRYGEDDTPFASTKNPVMTVTAGETAKIVLKRSDFTALTKVAVKVTAQSDKKKYKDTATAGVDFEYETEVVEWDDDSEDEQEVSFVTRESSDLTMSKQFTVTIAALTTDDYVGWDKPTLAAGKITVKIVNSEASAAFATVQNDLKADGVTLSAKGTWYLDSDGNYRSVEAKSSTTSFSVVGPGLFEVDPVVYGKGVLTCKIGDAEAFECTNRVTTLIAKKSVKSGKKTVAGATSVVFTLQDDAGESYVSFNPLANGDVCRWVPLALEPDAPYYNAVVTNVSELSWKVPAELEGDLMLYRVRFGTWTGTPVELTNCTVETSCIIPEEYNIDPEPGQTCYWRVDCALARDMAECEAMLSGQKDIDWIDLEQAWSFSIAEAGATSTEIAGVDCEGVEYLARVEANEAIQLVQGVKLSEVEMGPNQGNSSLNRIVSGQLPPGLKLATGAGQGQITGTPTTPGTYKVLLQTAVGVKSGKKTVHTYAATLPLVFEVAPMGSANGSFAGTLVQTSGDCEKGAAKIGKLSFSATTAGKLSATAVIAGNKYTFSGTGFDAAWSEDGDIDRIYEVTLTANRSYNSGNLKLVDELAIELNDGPVTNLATFAAAAGKATVRLNIVNKTSGSGVSKLGEAEYVCDLERNNKAVEGYAEAMAGFTGVYNVALAAPGVTAEDGVPAGHGYVSLQVAASGEVKISGKLADGTSISGSSVATLHGDLEAPESCQLFIPVAFNNSTYSFGGVAVVSFADSDEGNASWLDATKMLAWYKDGTSATASGEALELALEPNGGWYDTVSNLQRHYLDRDFTVDGAEVLLNGNTVTFDKTGLETTSALTYTLNRATGLVTGTLTYAGVKNTKHFGIQFMHADEVGSLASGVFAAGFFTHKVNSKWTESLPFDILMSDVVDRDWSEVEYPVAE